MFVYQCSQNYISRSVDISLKNTFLLIDKKWYGVGYIKIKVSLSILNNCIYICFNIGKLNVYYLREIMGKQLKWISFNCYITWKSTSLISDRWAVHLCHVSDSCKETHTACLNDSIQCHYIYFVDYRPHISQTYKYIISKLMEI